VIGPKTMTILTGRVEMGGPIKGTLMFYPGRGWAEVCAPTRDYDGDGRLIAEHPTAPASYWTEHPNAVLERAAHPLRCWLRELWRSISR